MPTPGESPGRLFEGLPARRKSVVESSTVVSRVCGQARAKKKPPKCSPGGARGLAEAAREPPTTPAGTAEEDAA